LYVIQGTTVRVEYGDAAIAADPAGAHVISHAFPHTYGQPLAHFLRKTAVVPDAKVISEHLAVRYIFHVLVHEKSFASQKSSLKDVNLIPFVPSAGLALSSVAGNPQEATMLFGDSMRLSRPTTKTANSLVFSVSNFILFNNHLGASYHLHCLHLLIPIRFC
jgi:hypothetical protein